MEEDRIVSPLRSVIETSYEEQLRPKHYDDFVGQSQVVENLKLFIEAAKLRDESLDHVLFHGPPGLGKTTLAHVVANELGVSVKSTSGPAIERKSDLAAIITDLKPRDVLFIDEIHRLSRVIEESLYPAMEEYKLDIIIGEGPHAKSIKLELPPFTLVGATTRAGTISSPLRTRFGITFRLQFYNEEEMKEIVFRSARILDVEISDDGAQEIAYRSRRTPRIANRLLRRVRDYAQVKADGKIDIEVARNALAMFEVDDLGLDVMDRQFLSTIIDKFNGGPVGLNTLAVALGEDHDTIEDVFEPFLIQRGLLDRTPRGRMATPLSYEHLDKKPPPCSESKDFFRREK